MRAHTHTVARGGAGLKMLYDITIKTIVHLGFNIRRFTVISIQEFQYTCRAVIYSLSRSERGTKRRRQIQPTAHRALARSERALQRWLVRRGQVTFFSPRTRVDALPLRCRCATAALPLRCRCAAAALSLHLAVHHRAHWLLGVSKKSRRVSAVPPSSRCRSSAPATNKQVAESR